MDILGAIINIGAVLLGFALSELASYSRRRRDDKDLQQSVRKMLSIEIARNLQHLRILLDEFKDEKGSNIPDMHGEMSAMRRIVMPAWENVVLLSQLQHMGAALDAYEAEKVLHFHSTLERLSILRNEIDTSENFFVAHRYLVDFVELATKTLNKGNPIG